MRPIACMNRDRPGGDAAKTAEPEAVRTRVVASAATRTALRRPDRTRNVAPLPAGLDAVSASMGPARSGRRPRVWGPRLGTPTTTRFGSAGDDGRQPPGA